MLIINLNDVANKIIGIAIETIFAIEIKIYLFQYIPIYTLTYPYFDGKMARRRSKGNVKLMVYRENM